MFSNNISIFLSSNCDSKFLICSKTSNILKSNCVCVTTSTQIKTKTICSFFKFFAKFLNFSIINFLKLILKHHFVFVESIIITLQKCPLMFFQKNIFENLELNRRLKISRITCYITFSFFISAFIFYLSSFYYYFHRSCALTICLSYHYI